MRSCLVLCLVLACPGLVYAQLRFTQPNADLGELRGGVVYQHRFEFVNDAATPIEVTEIRLGCGCLAPVYEKRVYQPGEKGSILMHIRTLGQPEGARTWNAHVQFRHADKKLESLLVIGAKIRNEVTIEPSIVAMTVETSLKQELTIVDRRATPFKITSVQATSSAIRASLQLGKDGVSKIVLEVTGSALKAARQEEMLNIYTDDPFYRQLQVPITLMKAARANVKASPARVEITGAGSQLVRLRASGDQAVRVDKIEVEHPALKCTWAAGPGNDATLKIAVTTAGDVQTNVRVHVGATVVSIPIQLRKE